MPAGMPARLGHLTPYGRKAVAKRAKYGNLKVEVGGIKFASVKEGRRYSQLKMLEEAGHIRGLTLQTVYPLTSNGVQVCKYLADFDYEEALRPDGSPWRGLPPRDGEAVTWAVVTEDAKGVQTPEFKLKSKMFTACYGRSIRLT